MTPWQHYQQALQQGFVADPAQEAAATALEHCYQQLVSNTPTQGLYLWGPVGRGKTWLMNRFYQSLQQVNIPVQRQHFHHFVEHLHRRLFQLTGTANPLQTVAYELAQQVKVLCFDELFISDIGNAMLLGPLLTALLKQELVIVATSNQAPDQLYADGFNREQLLPTIAALKQHLTVIHLDGGQDHRLHGQIVAPCFWVTDPNDTERFERLFKQLTAQKPKPQTLKLNGRSLNILGATKQVVWCDYQNLCEGYWDASDYMALCQQAQTLMLSNIPDLNAEASTQFIARGTEDGVSRVVAGDRNLAIISPKDNGVRRFIALIDECYERKTQLYLEAALPLNQLYQQGGLLFAFQRTQSRLEEMQRAPLQ